ncbi:hypothetical protein VTJ04DRAFT_2446 [Mycothermus thermophilus]|uniref:uncharacterized protein n=1 Tax=Humicola insolens TaxID=85995 RepID=UPI003744011A
MALQRHVMHPDNLPTSHRTIPHRFMKTNQRRHTTVDGGAYSILDFSGDFVLPTKAFVLPSVPRISTILMIAKSR